MLRAQVQRFKEVLLRRKALLPARSTPPIDPHGLWSKPIAPPHPPAG